MSEQSSASKAAPNPPTPNIPNNGRQEPNGFPSGANPDDSFVQIVNVVKKFGETTAVRGVNLSVKKGELFALLGSSGCGKSTLLRMLVGLESVTEGQILIDGEDLAQLPPYNRPVNMMFQSYALFPHMTVESNVAFGLKQEGVKGSELTDLVNNALQLVQMAKFAKRKPHQLSGGQQQRVALARRLVKRPKLLLLDEPMSALDKQIRQRTQIQLVNILDQVGVTCIMVTHDQEEAMTMANRLAVMSEGQIVQLGSPHQVYEYPNSRFSASFIGSTNLSVLRARGGRRTGSYLRGSGRLARASVCESRHHLAARHAGDHLRASRVVSRAHAQAARRLVQLGTRQDYQYRVHGRLYALPRDTR